MFSAKFEQGREWEVDAICEVDEADVFAGLESEQGSGHAWADEMEHVDKRHDRADWAAHLTAATAAELGREWAEPVAKLLNKHGRADTRVFTGGMLKAIDLASNGGDVGPAVGRGFNLAAIDLYREGRFFSCGKGRVAGNLDVGSVQVVSLAALPVEQAGEVDLADSPADIAVRNEAFGRLWEAVRALPSRERRMVVGVYRLGMSVPQVAGLLRLTKKAGYNVLDRALARLRTVLEA